MDKQELFEAMPIFWFEDVAWYTERGWKLNADRRRPRDTSDGEAERSTNPTDFRG